MQPPPPPGLTSLPLGSRVLNPSKALNALEAGSSIVIFGKDGKVSQEYVLGNRPAKDNHTITISRSFLGKSDPQLTSRAEFLTSISKHFSHGSEVRIVTNQGFRKGGGFST